MATPSTLSPKLFGRYKNKKLTDRQVLFVSEYLKDFNGKRAAAEAGYKDPATAAAKLLNSDKNPHVAREVGKAIRARLHDNEITVGRILQELNYLGFRDIVDLVDETGEVYSDLNEMPEIMRRCIDGFEQEVTYFDDGTKEIKNKVRLTSKIKALELLMQHFGMMSPQEHFVRHSIDWDNMLEPPDPSHKDPVEVRLLEEDA